MLKNLLSEDDDQPPGGMKSPTGGANIPTQDPDLFDPDPYYQANGADKKDFVLSRVEPESFAETTRKSGLAWSAGIAFFASVVFMLVIGWGADLLFGSSPWGLVGGIVVGSLIGFVQFFRLTSQIFPK